MVMIFFCTCEMRIPHTANGITIVELSTFSFLSATKNNIIIHGVTIFILIIITVIIIWKLR